MFERKKQPYPNISYSPATARPSFGSLSFGEAMDYEVQECDQEMKVVHQKNLVLLKVLVYF